MDRAQSRKLGVNTKWTFGNVPQPHRPYPGLGECQTGMALEDGKVPILPKLEVEHGSNSGSSGRYWTRQEKRLWLVAMLTGCSMIYACRTVMPLSIVSMGKELNWDKTDSGAVLSAFFWGYAMTQILGGYLSDLIGGEKLLMSGAIGWTLITFWTPQLVRLCPNKSSGLVLIVISRVIIGCFQGVHYPSLTSLFAQKVPEEERALSYSFAVSGSPLGTLITGSIGSILLDQYGWAIPFHLLGLLGMIWLLFLRYYLVARDRRKALVLSMKDNMTSHPTKEAAKVPWVALFSKPGFWAVVVGHFCNNNAYFILLSWLPTYFHETFPGEKGWVFNVVPWLVSVPSQWLAGWIADSMLTKGFSTTHVRKIMQTVSFGGVGSFLILISYTSSYEMALFCMSAAITCGGFHSAGILVNPQDIAPKYAGSVFGLMNTAGAIPGFVGVYIAGYILESTQSWAAVFNQTAAVCFFGWLVFIMFGTGKKIVS